MLETLSALSLLTIFIGSILACFSRKPDMNNEKDRNKIIKKAVKRTVKEYGKALEKLGKN